MPGMNERDAQRPLERNVARFLGFLTPGEPMKGGMAGGMMGMYPPPPKPKDQSPITKAMQR